MILTHKNNYCYGYVSRISFHHAHTDLKKKNVDLIIPFINELSDSIIVALKLNINFCKNSLKDGIQETLLLHQYIYLLNSALEHVCLCIERLINVV